MFGMLGNLRKKKTRAHSAQVDYGDNSSTNADDVSPLASVGGFLASLTLSSIIPALLCLAMVIFVVAVVVYWTLCPQQELSWATTATTGDMDEGADDNEREEEVQGEMETVKDGDQPAIRALNNPDYSRPEGAVYSDEQDTERNTKEDDDEEHTPNANKSRRRYLSKGRKQHEHEHASTTTLLFEEIDEDQMHRSHFVRPSSKEFEKERVIFTRKPQFHARRTRSAAPPQSSNNNNNQSNDESPEGSDGNARKQNDGLTKSISTSSSSFDFTDNHSDNTYYETPKTHSTARSSSLSSTTTAQASVAPRVFTSQKKPAVVQKQQQQQQRETTPQLSRSVGLLELDRWVVLQVDLCKKGPYTLQMVDKLYKAYLLKKTRFNVTDTDLVASITKAVTGNKEIGVFNKLRMRSVMNEFKNKGFKCT